VLERDIKINVVLSKTQAMKGIAINYRKTVLFLYNIEHYLQERYVQKEILLFYCSRSCSLSSSLVGFKLFLWV